MSDLSLTIPVEEIVRDALLQLNGFTGLDREEAYLLERLARGEKLRLVSDPEDES